MEVALAVLLAALLGARNAQTPAPLSTQETPTATRRHWAEPTRPLLANGHVPTTSGVAPFYPSVPRPSVGYYL